MPVSQTQGTVLVKVGFVGGGEGGGKGGWGSIQIGGAAAFFPMQIFLCLLSKASRPFFKATHRSRKSPLWEMGPPTVGVSKGAQRVVCTETHNTGNVFDIRPSKGRGGRVKGSLSNYS